MPILDDIRKLLRRPASAPPVADSEEAQASTEPSESRALVLAEPDVAVDPGAIREALARLRLERKRLRGEIETLKAKRRAALVGASADRTILNIDRAAESVALELERLDAAEPALKTRLLEAEEAKRTETIDIITGAYADVWRAFAASMRVASELRDKMAHIREVAVQNGLETMLHYFEIPLHTVTLDQGQLYVMEHGSIAQLRYVKGRPPGPEVFPVRFRRWTLIYRTGEVAAFDAEQAWAFVEAGRADFVDPDLVPAKPPAAYERAAMLRQLDLTENPPTEKSK